jgi:hypothetical protein
MARKIVPLAEQVDVANKLFFSSTIMPEDRPAIAAIIQTLMRQRAHEWQRHVWDNDAWDDNKKSVILLDEVDRLK